MNDIVKNSKTDKVKLKNALAENKQHLKYKNKVTIQTAVTLVSTILFSLSLIFLLFLPIFQIKYELLGVTLEVNNFSIYDNYIDVSNAYNESLHYFTDIKSSALKSFFILTLFSISYIIVSTFFTNLKSFNAEKRTEKYFVEAKIDKSSFYSMEILGFCLVAIGIQIATIIICKNAEFKFTIDTHYTVTNVDNYLYYYSNNIFLMRVFQNNFKFFNGVSGYIAIPIIFFVLAAALFVAGLYLKNKNKTAMMNEVINGFDEIKTVENNQ